MEEFPLAPADPDGLEPDAFDDAHADVVAITAAAAIACTEVDGPSKIAAASAAACGLDDATVFIILPFDLLHPASELDNDVVTAVLEMDTVDVAIGVIEFTQLLQVVLTFDMVMLVEFDVDDKVVSFDVSWDDKFSFSILVDCKQDKLLSPGSSSTALRCCSTVIVVIVSDTSMPEAANKEVDDEFAEDDAEFDDVDVDVFDREEHSENTFGT